MSSWFKSYPWQREAWLRETGVEGIAFWSALHSYCAEYLTDGVVPATAFDMIAAEAMVARSTDIAAIFLSWQSSGKIVMRVDGSLRIIGYLDPYDENQISEAERNAARDAGRKRKADYDQRKRTESNAAGNVGGNGVTNVESNETIEGEKEDIEDISNEISNVEFSIGIPESPKSVWRQYHAYGITYPENLDEQCEAVWQAHTDSTHRTAGYARSPERCHWVVRALCGDKRAKHALDPYPLADILDAVRGWEFYDMYNGSKDGPKRLDIDLHLRDATRIERCRDAYRSRPGVPVAPPPPSESDLAFAAEVAAKKETPYGHYPEHAKKGMCPCDGCHVRVTSPPLTIVSSLIERTRPALLEVLS